jgi:hypothetical protein
MHPFLWSKTVLHINPGFLFDVYFTFSEYKVEMYCKKILKYNFGKFKTVLELSTMRSKKETLILNT